MKTNRTLVSLIVVFLVANIGLASQANTGIPALAPVVIRPLNSTLPNPAQLNSCVNNAIGFTQYAYPSTTPISVVLAQQVTDEQFMKLAPHLAYHFGVLTNLVILRGGFRHPRSGRPMPYILYILTPYPECAPTVVTFDVRDFALPAQEP